MKKALLFLTISMATCLFLFENQTFAQTSNLVEWTWDTYKTKFKVPKDFKITKNVGKSDKEEAEFSAGNPYIDLSIFPFENEAATEKKDMINDLLTWAKDNKVADISQVKSINNINGYWGYYLEGKDVEGTKNPLFVGILVDPDYPTIVLYVWVTYPKSTPQVAKQILESFQPN